MDQRAKGITETDTSNRWLSSFARRIEMKTSTEEMAIKSNKKQTEKMANQRMRNVYWNFATLEWIGRKIVFILMHSLLVQRIVSYPLRHRIVFRNFELNFIFLPFGDWARVTKRDRIIRPTTATIVEMEFSQWDDEINPKKCMQNEAKWMRNTVHREESRQTEAFLWWNSRLRF